MQKGETNGEWEEVTLEEVANEITVGYVGSMASEYVDSGIPFLRSLNVEPLRINDNDIKFITPEFHRRIQKSKLSPGDVVIVRTGKPGSCSVIPDWLSEANCSDLVIVRCGDRLDKRFLAYYVNSAASHHVASHLVGAVQQHFNVGAARTLRINLPPLSEQKRIVQILGTLDDKIELNRRMNATLEAMARALFQSWFVDFDPVRRNAEGGDLRPEDSLYPEAFEDSEMGEIPRGWEVVRLDEIALIKMGLSPKGDSYNSEGVGTPLINGPVEFGNYFPVKAKWTEAGTRFAAAGDLIFCVRGSTTGRRVISDSEYAIGRGVCSIRAKDGFHSFLYQTINVGLNRLLEKTTGSVFPSLSAPDIKSFPVLKPSKGVLEAYEQTAKPLIERIQQNQHQSRTLAALRDTLLPKLLSGELPAPPLPLPAHA
jgi:type I restriction enzyme S subunit